MGTPAFATAFVKFPSPAKNSRKRKSEELKEVSVESVMLPGSRRRSVASTGSWEFFEEVSSTIASPTTISTSGVSSGAALRLSAAPLTTGARAAPQ